MVAHHVAEQALFSRAMLEHDVRIGIGSEEIIDYTAEPGGPS